MGNHLSKPPNAVADRTERPVPKPKELLGRVRTSPSGGDNVIVMVQDISWLNYTELGCGGFGSVFCVTFRDRKVALKLQKKTPCARREIKYLKRIKRHPNILPLIAYHCSNKYLVTLSPVAACSVKCLIKRNVDLRGEAPFVAACMYCAVNHLHALNVAHRDVKDSNVLVLRGGTPVLCDFGLACKFDPSTKMCMQKQPVAGTAGFMAPEIARKLYSGPASDYWSLGALTCRCLNGKLPHDYINERYGMARGDESYHLRSLGKFSLLDLNEIYNLSTPEKVFLEACFTYFKDIDLNAIERGHRIPKLHDRMQQHVELYLKQRGRNLFNDAAAG